MELRKRLEDVYTKLYNVGESSILRKSDEERKQEFTIEAKKTDDDKKVPEAVEKRSSTGFFATEVRV